jgi:hypothetical protein
MIIGKRDNFTIRAPLECVPALDERALAWLWPDSDSGRENMTRRLAQLTDEGLLTRHTAIAAVPEEVSLFYHWVPGMQEPDFGPLAWELERRWAAIEPRRVVFYTASERAARHYGRKVRSPLKSAGALSHNLTLGMVFMDYALRRPTLVSGWVCEDVIAESRGHGEKVVDACIVDSTGTPALCVEVAGRSYAASNGTRLREIHRDCAARSLPYEMWPLPTEGRSDS